jgi:lipid-A-disaccharide synthase
LYGSLLIEALGKRLGGAEFFGCGGDRMRAAGCRTLVDARQLAMVGIVEVLPGLPRAWRALQLLKNAAKKERPALAILVDFPDFNLRLAKELKRIGTPVLYFVAPQVWAWRPGRLKTLRRNVDRLLCIFPFEEAFFQAGNVAAEFVGHPLVTRVEPSLSAEEFRDRFGLPGTTPLVALLPGSRRREIELNLPPLIETARILAASKEYCFVVPAASTVGAEWIRGQVRESGLAFHVVEGHTYDVVGHSRAAVVASGTATIETALLGTPMVVVYRVSRATWMLGSGLVHTPFYSMVNIVAGQRIVPEFIQGDFQPEAVARDTRLLLESELLRDRMRQQFRDMAEKLHAPAALPPSRLPAAREHPADKTPLQDDKFMDPIQRAAGIAESFLQGAAGSKVRQWSPGFSR